MPTSHRVTFHHRNPKVMDGEGLCNCMSLKQICIMAGQKQLWEINDVVLSNNYSNQDSEYGVYYSLTTSSADILLINNHLP